MLYKTCALPDIKIFVAAGQGGDEIGTCSQKAQVVKKFFPVMHALYNTNQSKYCCRQSFCAEVQRCFTKSMSMWDVKVYI